MSPYTLLKFSEASSRISIRLWQIRKSSYSWCAGTGGQIFSFRLSLPDLALIKSEKGEVRGASGSN
jgi:hypothetical protein